MSNSYPFKKSILGMIPEGVTVDEDYVKQLAISKGIDIQTICSMWYEAMKVEHAVVEIGSSKEALQRTIDERDETIESLEEKIKNLINERDHYKKENMELKEDIKTTGNLLEKSKASYVDLRDKYDILVEEFRGLENANKGLHKQLQENNRKYNNLCKEKREYDTLAEEYEGLEKVNKDLTNENKKLYDNNRQLNKDLSDAEDTICKLKDANTTYKEDLGIIGGYYKDLQLDRNNICKELFQLRPELENAKDTICMLRDDLEEQYKRVKYMEDNYISKQVAQEERGYAEREIKQRIEDTKDLIRAIHTISKFI